MDGWTGIAVSVIGSLVGVAGLIVAGWSLYYRRVSTLTAIESKDAAYNRELRETLEALLTHQKEHFEQQLSEKDEQLRMINKNFEEILGDHLTAKGQLDVLKPWIQQANLSAIRAFKISDEFLNSRSGYETVNIIVSKIIAPLIDGKPDIPHAIEMINQGADRDQLTNLTERDQALYNIGIMVNAYSNSIETMAMIRSETQPAIKELEKLSNI